MIAYKPGILGLCVQGELILTGSLELYSALGGAKPSL